MPAQPGYLQREKRHLLRFLVAGGLSVATDLGVFLALREALAWPQALSKGLSYAAGMALGFALNKWWTFGSRRQAGGEAAGYALLYASTLGVNVLAYGAALDAAAGLGLEPRPAKAAAFLAATGLTTVLNYLGLRYLTFRRGIAERHALEETA